MERRRFVVLDRDGTVIVERHYLSDPSQIELLHGAAGGLSQMKKMDLGLVVITNQSGVGRGFFDQSRLDLIHQQLYQLLDREGVQLEGIYVCPHTPEDHCSCRKPELGLLMSAAKELDFDPKASFVIGDQISDIEFGHRVGAITLLVRTGYGAQVAAQGAVACDYIVDDLADAARVIEGLLYSNKGHSA